MHSVMLLPIGRLQVAVRIATVHIIIQRAILAGRRFVFIAVVASRFRAWHVPRPKGPVSRHTPTRKAQFRQHKEPRSCRRSLPHKDARGLGQDAYYYYYYGYYYYYYYDYCDYY